MQIKKSLLFLIIIVLMIAGCSSEEGVQEFGEPLSNEVERHEEGVGPHEHLADEEVTGQMELVLVPAELVVGPNRFAVGIFDPGGYLVHDAEVHFHFYDLSDMSTPVLEMEVNAVPIHSPDGEVTIFTYEREFNRAGDWGVEVEARMADGNKSISGIRFIVEADSKMPGIGDKVPEVRTKTVADVGGDYSLLTSAETPNPALHQLSLNEAITTGKPTFLLFATPAFCETRFCGPSYEITSDLEARYGEQVNFIHVEVFTGLPNPDQNGWQVVPAVSAFNLLSEPWAFLLDENGVVLYRFDGLFTIEEVERHMKEELGL